MTDDVYTGRPLIPQKHETSNLTTMRCVCTIDRDSPVNKDETLRSHHGFEVHEAGKETPEEGCDDQCIRASRRCGINLELQPYASFDE